MASTLSDISEFPGVYDSQEAETYPEFDKNDSIETRGKSRKIQII
jgi:hypothetical protein